MGGKDMKSLADKFKKSSDKSKTSIKDEQETKIEKPIENKEKPILKDEVINDKNYYIKLKKELKGVKIKNTETVYVDENLKKELQMIKAFTGIPISVFVTSILKRELKKHDKDYKEFILKNL